VMTEIRNKVPELNSAWADDYIITLTLLGYIGYECSYSLYY
jgi:hypothetical protein